VWTFIYKHDLENFLNKYPQLAEIFNDIALYDMEDRIYFPRLFYKNYPECLDVFRGSKQHEFQRVNFKFTQKLRANQIPIVNYLLNYYQKNNNQINGIAKMPPGTGKTVMAIYLASKIGLKTMVIVDNDNLLKQWVKAFLDFTDLTEEDIGIIKQKFFVTDTPVTVALVQTLLSRIKQDLSRNFSLIDKAEYGLVIYDEVHATSSAPKFAKASLLFRTQNILGLSATPFQTGTAEILMKNTIGDIIFETKDYDMKPKYVLNYYDSGLTSKYSYALSRQPDYIKRKAFYNSIIVKSKEYYNLIVNLVKKRLEEGHVIMILCFTKEQVKTISERLTVEGVENRRFYGDEKEDVDKDNVKVLIVTYAYAGKGFDFKQLSSLILAVNLAGKKSLIQVIGRILRKHDEKLSPVVDDLIDLAFTSIFIPDTKVKIKIIKDEFHCDINHCVHGDITYNFSELK